MKLSYLPTLSGTIVDLRLPEEGDYSALKIVLNDQETMKALVPFFQVTVWDDEMVVQRYERFNRARTERTGINYTVRLKKTGEIIGSCGFKNIDHDKKRAEFGVILHRSSWGKATIDCIRVALNSGFEDLKLKEIYFETDYHNTRAKNLCERRGIPFLGKTAEGYLVYAIKAEEWPSISRITML